MFIQFLVEDQSGEKLIDAVLAKFKLEKPHITIEYQIKSYKGIGGLKKGPDVQNIKSQYLLTELPKRMRAFNNTLGYMENASLFIVLDNDTRNTDDFKNQLSTVAKQNKVSIDHVFCIAVEEMEAWLLGDRQAIKDAYPRLHNRIDTKHSNYKQDSICGTWELLADMLTKNGLNGFRKEHPTAMDVGKCKGIWAEKIGKHLRIRENASPSFNYFINELDQRVSILL
ncbi:MAG: DUF4276 family protein [Firmicutes bacterium]|nr:DUF4276 family protein [Bacillota bacterium]